MSAPAEFAILRVEKHKSVGAVASLAGHALRVARMNPVHALRYE